MSRRSLSKRHPSLISSLPLTMSRYGLAVSLLSGALFVMPTANAASCKIPKSYYKNVACTANSSYFLATKDSGAPVALLNNKGVSVVDLSRYQKVDVNQLAGGLLPVQRSNRVGYLNMKGREVVPAMYDVLTDSQGWARPVSDGRIVVKKDGKYGVVNTANKIIVPFSAAISDIDEYQNGRARVRKDRAVSWLDKNGKTTSEPNSAANTQSTTKQSSANTSSNVSSSKQSASNRFTTLQPRKQDGKWGFVDDDNVTMITYSFDEARPFSEGLAGVRIGKDWGFVNLGGELVIPFRFANSGVSAGGSYKGQSAFVFTDGKAWIGNLKNGNKMCVDKKGDGVNCS
ncbi:WG repeat-containing protein [Psychrobacter sp. AOP22-C1-C5]|uniref:WG repeat-containing protein n=1 Tax=Psychrobacter sp. AOP22-C1-C5 TaxID=3457716 RepID=UPI0040373B7A